MKFRTCVEFLLGSETVKIQQWTIACEPVITKHLWKSEQLPIMLFFEFYAAILTRLKFRNISLLNDSFQRSISLLIFNIAEHKISFLFF